MEKLEGGVVQERKEMANRLRRQNQSAEEAARIKKIAIQKRSRHETLGRSRCDRRQSDQHRQSTGQIVSSVPNLSMRPGGEICPGVSRLGSPLHASFAAPSGK